MVANSRSTSPIPMGRKVPKIGLSDIETFGKPSDRNLAILFVKLANGKSCKNIYRVFLEKCSIPSRFKNEKIAMHAIEKILLIVGKSISFPTDIVSDLEMIR
jgi:hypothetical protein